MTTTKDAAIFLLDERIREHDRTAARARIATVYHDAAPVPEGADPAVQIVEKAVFAAGVVEAMHHQQQADHFREALAAIEGLGK